MKLKTLALAALVAVAAPSFAAVQTAGEIGQAEYVLVATNAAGSYFQDLGVSTDGLATMLNTTGSFTQAVTGTEYTKFLNFGGTNTTWSIVAVQPLADGFSPGEINAWTTVNVNQALGRIQNSQSNDGTNNLTTAFIKNDNASNPKLDNNTKASAFGTSTYLSNGLLNFNGFFNTRNAVGTSSEMVYLTPSSDVTDEATQYSVLKNVYGSAYTATFDGSTVSLTAAVAAIPEPSSYAMLLAGIAAVGFVARRRKSA
jgi:PEP-CTERM motif